MTPIEKGFQNGHIIYVCGEQHFNKETSLQYVPEMEFIFSGHVATRGKRYASISEYFMTSFSILILKFDLCTSIRNSSDSLILEVPENKWELKLLCYNTFQEI